MLVVYTCSLRVQLHGSQNVDEDSSSRIKGPLVPLLSSVGALKEHSVETACSIGVSKAT